MTRRQVKKFNNCINKKKETKCSNNENGEHENLCEIEKKKMFSSCIDRNEFILGILTFVEW